MKSILLIDDLMPGGLERMLFEWLRRKSPDHQIKVATLFGDGPLADEIRRLGITIESFQLSDRGFWAGMAIARDFVKDFKPDLAYCMREGARAIFPFFLKRWRVPAVMMRWDNSIIQRSWKQAIPERFQVYFADGFQSCSQVTAHGVQKIYSGCVVDVVPNGVDLSRFPIEKTNLPESPLRIISVGNLRAEKNHLAQIEIARQLKGHGVNFSLEIVGEGPLREILEHKIISLGLQDRVKLSGRCSDVPERLMRSHVFLFTSTREGFPVAVLEAMAAGLPCVLFDLPVFSEVDPMKSVFTCVPQENYQAAVEKMIGFIKNAGSRKDLGHRAREWVQEKFSMEISTQAWENSLRNCYQKRKNV